MASTFDLYSDPTVPLTAAAAAEIDSSGAPPVLNRFALGKRTYQLEVDRDTALAGVEALTQGPIAYNSLTYAANATATNTITIDGLVFEFVAAGGAVANNANIAVTRGATGTLSYAAFVEALNATNASNQHATITNVATTAPALANSTKNLFAVQVVTGADAGTVYVYNADKPGGTKVEGLAPSMAFSDTLTEAINWRYANLNLGGGVGFAPATKHIHVRHVVTTADIALPSSAILFQVPFVPQSWTFHAQTAAGVPIVNPNVVVTVPTAVEGQNILSVGVPATAGSLVGLQNGELLFLSIYGA
jgi:hypothetical protein